MPRASGLPTARPFLPMSLFRTLNSAWTYRNLLPRRRTSALEQPPHRAVALFDESVCVVLRNPAKIS